MFHQINELMVLGMHSLIPYLRRNRSAPILEDRQLRNTAPEGPHTLAMPQRNGQLYQPFSLQRFGYLSN